MQEVRNDQDLWVWGDSVSGVEVRFTGRHTEQASETSDTRQLAQLVGAQRCTVSWAEQIHSGRILEATPGLSGQGDALWTDREDFALVVVTADCVPLLLAGYQRIAAVHAGWRGIVEGIVPAALAAFEEPGEALTAWVGPAIGPCCYEVGEEVAEKVVTIGGNEILRSRPGRRPHVDLRGAVIRQLQDARLQKIHRIENCTHCEGDRLWSYRRQGPHCGRNRAIIWRRNTDPSQGKSTRCTAG